MRSGPGEARTILLLDIISVRPSKQPLMVRTFLKVYMELGSSFLFLQEQIKTSSSLCIERNTLCMCIYTMSIHSVYLVSDLEGSDNGDPLNGLLFRGSLHTRSTTEVVRSMKCSYRKKKT